MIQCPRCFGTNVSPVGNSHYVCNNKNCTKDPNKRTQFQISFDSSVKFPYNEIFVNRPKSEFYKNLYLQIKEVGITSV